MAITLLQGRLGNQLFEYAFARARFYETGEMCILSEAPLHNNGIANKLTSFRLADDVRFVKYHRLTLLQQVALALYARLARTKDRTQRFFLEQKLKKPFSFCGVFCCENGYILPPP